MFPKPLILKHKIGKANEFILHSNFEYIGKKYHIIIRKGMDTDGASNARIFWNIIPPMSGKYLEAAVIHDGLYRSNLVSRKEADKIFYEAMEDLGVSWWKRKVIYSAVRAFGWASYRNKKERIQLYRIYVKVIKLGG